MEKTLEVIKKMQEAKLFKKYAIGGAIGSIFYIEPITTYDLDIMIILPETNKAIISLSPIYNWLTKSGYKAEKEHVIIEGIPVQFIPAYNELVTEAVNNALRKKFGNVETYVIRPEYLITIMLDTNRAKDMERIARFLKETEIDFGFLQKILKKYNLSNKFKKFKKWK